MALRLVPRVVTHRQEGRLLVSVGGLGPARLPAQALGVLHGHQPVTLEAARRRQKLNEKEHSETQRQHSNFGDR